MTYRCKYDPTLCLPPKQSFEKFPLLGLYCSKSKKACSRCYILHHARTKTYCAPPTQLHNNENNENTERPDFQHHLEHLRNTYFPTSDNCCRVNGRVPLAVRTRVRLGSNSGSTRFEPGFISGQTRVQLGCVSTDHIQGWHSHVTSRVALSTANTLPEAHRSTLPLSLLVTGPKV